MHIDRQQYPRLFAPFSWGVLRLQFELRDAPPPVSLIANVNIMAYTDGGWVLLEMATGEYDIIGGTLEPGEMYLDTLRRELLEEAGAQLVTFSEFGAFYCRSSAPAPYRAHLPHPEFYRVVGYGRVELLQRPTLPAGGEAVKAVYCLALDEVTRRLRGCNRPELAELYRLAAAIQAQQG